MDAALTKEVFNHIESEIRNYFFTLKELAFLEKYFLEEYELEPWPEEMAHLRGPRVVIQAKYNHLKEVLNAIRQAFEETTEEQKHLLYLIYHSETKEACNSEEERCRKDYVNKIANYLGWK